MGLNYGFYATWALNIQKQPLENNKFEYDMSRVCSQTVKIEHLTTKHLSGQVMMSTLKLFLI